MISEIDLELKTKEIPWYLGKEFIFLKIGFDLNESWKFSSNINSIGIEWDIVLKNSTRVIVISEPKIVNSEKYRAPLELIKVLAPMPVWIPTSDLHQINDV